MTMTATRVRASDKQLAFLRRLADERIIRADWTKEQTLANLEQLIESGLDKGTASNMIGTALKAPYREQPQHADPGYYVTDDGDFVVVVENKAKTSTYAKRLVVTETVLGRKHAEWVYAPGVGRTLAGLTPMTAQQAAQFGHLHGICVRCLRPLDDPASAIVGYGQVCAKHMGWPYPTTKAQRQALGLPK